MGAPDFVFHDQVPGANRYAAEIDGRRLIVSFPRYDDDVDRGTATWSACWEDDPDRTFTGEVSFKHHITAHDVEGVMRIAVAVAPRALP